MPFKISSANEVSELTGSTSGMWEIALVRKCSYHVTSSTSGIWDIAIISIESQWNLTKINKNVSCI